MSKALETLQEEHQIIDDLASEKSDLDEKDRRILEEFKDEAAEQYHATNESLSEEAAKVTLDGSGVSVTPAEQEELAESGNINELNNYDGGGRRA